MRRRIRLVLTLSWLLGLALVSLPSPASANIPKLINFQGILRDTLGNILPDSSYSITFRIYDDSSGGNTLWQESQSVSISAGLFSHLLGSSVALSGSVFNDSTRWIAIQVGSDPEILPRRRLVSTPYAYVADFAQDADLLDGLNSSDFLDTTSDFGRSGVAADLFESATTLTSKYVNVAGPDSVVSTSGTAFMGKVSGSSSNPHYGVSGSAENSSTGTTFGGRFEASGAGTGLHYGVYGSASGSSSSSTYGCYGTASNTSSGNVFGGYFRNTTGGTGTHFGVYGEANGPSISPIYGSYGVATNTSSGDAYGGRFMAIGFGTGINYGVYGIEAAGGSGWAVYAAGDFAASGTKSAVVKTSTGHRLYYTVESPEVWFEDFGEGQLVNGQAHIKLDPLFLETVTINTANPMKVFVQLKDDCNGTYAKGGTTGFDVLELKNGTSHAAFSYRIVAKRKGYETQRLKQTDAGMDDPNLYPELWDKIEKEHQERKAEMEKSRIQN